MADNTVAPALEKFITALISAHSGERCRQQSLWQTDMGLSVQMEADGSGARIWLRDNGLGQAELARIALKKTGVSARQVPLSKLDKDLHSKWRYWRPGERVFFEVRNCDAEEILSKATSLIPEARQEWWIRHMAGVAAEKLTREPWLCKEIEKCRKNTATSLDTLSDIAERVAESIVCQLNQEITSRSQPNSPPTTGEQRISKVAQEIAHALETSKKRYDYAHPDFPMPRLTVESVGLFQKYLCGALSSIGSKEVGIR